MSTLEPDIHVYVKVLFKLIMALLSTHPLMTYKKQESAALLQAQQQHTKPTRAMRELLNSDTERGSAKHGVLWPGPQDAQPQMGAVARRSSHRPAEVGIRSVNNVLSVIPKLGAQCEDGER